MAARASRVSALLEQLSDLRDSLLDALATSVVTLLRVLLTPNAQGETGILRDDARQGFVTAAEKLEATTMRVLAKDSARVYTSILTELGVQRPTTPIMPAPEPYDWGQVFDQVAESVRAGIDVDDDALDDLEDALEVPLEEAVEGPQQQLRTRIYREAEKRAGVGPLRYRRVVHPELSRGGACGLCVAASARIYREADLKPIHARCKCEVVPITAAGDPGDSLNRLDLGDLYEAAGDSTSAARLKHVRVDAQGRITSTVKPTGDEATRGARALSAATPTLLDDTEKLRHQIDLTDGLPDSPWRTKQLVRLRGRLEELLAA